MVSRIRNLTGLAAVVQVAQHGSFVRASRALGLSSSATSKAIGRLEADLGVKFFHRTTRSVSLTAEGKAFVEGVSPLLQELDALTTEASVNAETPRGLLRVSAPETFGRVVIAPKLAEFSRRYPEVSVNLLLDDRNSDLAEERVDVAVRSGDLPDRANLVARRLLSDTLLVCSADAYFQKNGVPSSPNELADHACIRFRNAQTGRPMPWVFRGGDRLLVGGQLTASNMSVVAKLAASGAGIAQLPAYLAQPYLASGQLTEVLVQHRPESTPYHVVYLDRRFVAPRIRAFVDFIATRDA